METNTTSRVALLREPNPELLRTPPYNTEAEQALLGAILINNTAYYRVCEFLQPEQAVQPGVPAVLHPMPPGGP